MATRGSLKIVFETEAEEVAYREMLRQLRAEPLSDVNIGPLITRRYVPLRPYSSGKKSH